MADRTGAVTPIFDELVEEFRGRDEPPDPPVEAPAHEPVEQPD